MAARPHCPLVRPLTPLTLSHPLPSPEQVSPFHASLLMHFQGRPEWPAGELAEVMGVASEVLRRKIIFWINQGEWRRAWVGGWMGGGDLPCCLLCFGWLQRQGPCLPSPLQHPSPLP